MFMRILSIWYLACRNRWAVQNLQSDPFLKKGQVQSSVLELSLRAPWQVNILRSDGYDQWHPDAEQPLAAGRVGQLRGPAAICVDAVLETNLGGETMKEVEPQWCVRATKVPFGERSRALVATAKIEGEALEKALMCTAAVSLKLELQSAKASSLNGPAGTPIGRLAVSLGAALDPKILPACFMPSGEVSAESGADECIVAQLGPAKGVPVAKTLEDISRTQQLFAS
ncbi:unnamed protein product [Durusdinium trenchii]|uniref:Uncharacterized protein n=1 Tax=Durusdinium trenchii TaxID=1381693 RepID=A0ABP0Q3A8_9DINO